MSKDNVSSVPWLWVPEDISQLLTGSEGTDKIEGIALNYQAITDVKVSSQAFTGMKNLRFLKFQNANASHGPNSLPHDLRWLDWHGYPSKSLPGSFKGERLVSLNMQYSRVIQLWKGLQLEMLILSGCSKLESFPEIDGPMACLLDVYAEATALRELPSSIEFLTCLRLINLSYCKHLTSLPSSICGLKGLKVLTLFGCSKFDKLPDELGEMECLKELNCDETAIQELPPSISRLKKLRTFSLRGCKPPASLFHHLLLPGSFQVTKASSLHHLSALSSLVELDLSDCSMLDGGIACDLGTLSSLVLLNLSNNKFGSIPAEAISRLPKLVELFLVGCENLEILPQLPSSLTTVCLDECTALEGSIDSLAKYKNLNKISITKCDQLLEDEDNSQIMIDSMWQHLLKGVSAEDDNFYICFPGTNIPEWFTYKNWGPSILVNLPQNWYNNKFLGFELCVVSEMIDTTKPLHHFNIGVRYGINAKCSLITPDGEKAFVGGGIGFMGIKQYMDSNITCLGYYSFEKWMLYLRINWVGSPNEWCQFEVSSEEGYSKNIVHKGFGVRLIYEEDDVKQSDEAEMSQSSSSQSRGISTFLI
nr:TMV resistance protein N-like [Ipomoea trifida]